MEQLLFCGQIIFLPKKGNFPKNMDFNELSGNSHILKVHKKFKIFKSIAGGLGKVFEKTFLIETCYNVLRQLLRMSPKITYQSKLP